MTDNVDTKDNADIAAPAPAPVPAKSSGADDFAKTYQEVSQARQQSSTPSSWELIGKKVLPDSVPTSADFWVPLISAVGGYLGAGSPTVGGAVGRGLTAGASAWMAQQKQAEDIKNAIATRALEQERVGIAGRELGLRESQVQRQLNAAQNVAKILGGDIAAPKITTQQSTVGLKPPTTGTPTAAGVTPPAAATPPAGLAPSAAAETPAGGLAPATQAAQDFWSTVDPESNPTALFAEAAALDRASIASSMDPEIMKQMRDSANKMRETANAIRNRGIVTLKPEFGGQTVEIPGFAETQAKIEAAKTSATETARRQAEQNIMLSPENVKKEADKAAAIEQARRQAEQEVALSPAGIEGESKKAAIIKNTESNQKYFEDQATADRNRQANRVSLEAIKYILENYEPGKFAQQKADLVAGIRAFGIPVSATDTANPDAFEEFTKELMKGVFSSVKDIGGQLRVAELTGLERASNNPTMQPEANKKILSQALGLLDAEDKRSSDELDAWKNQGSKFNRALFQRDWRQNKENNLQNFINEQYKNIAVKGATPRNPEDYQVGHAYIVDPTPTNGLQKSTKLRFMGINPDTKNFIWQKVK